ncbi:hypothetical protein B0H65DRAFT_155668 [Neurospora tetraspora]|uniref:Uncharacterized protein n=1 Tax=Neurospora tetraspora TaxID=94610 RepID=A0AAE0MTF2_9PEZI|nr:hypothetical protein B0H65DRAFT_155668 [Neurospora tetraspora]
MFSSTERATRRASADQTTNHSAATMKPNQTFGEHPASGPAPSTAGFHKHDILNKLDPRVDSTMDHQPVAAMATAEGTYGHGPHEPGSHHHQHTGMGPSMRGGAGSSTTTTGSHHAYNQQHQQHDAVPEGGGYYGPTHSSRLANTTLDSHVDDPNHNNRMDNPNSDVPVPPQRHPHRHGFHHGVDVATNASTVTAAGTGHGLGAVGAHHNNQHLPQQGHATTAGSGSGFGSGHHVHDVGGSSNTTANLPGPGSNTAGPPHGSDLLK